MTRRRGFTLIELLVVLAIVATLMSFVSPRYFGSLDRSREIALKENLATLRHALDRYQDDTGRYPGALADLVSAKYLRKIPIDPVTESDATWIVVAATDAKRGGVFDVRSGAPGNSTGGVPYIEF